MLRKGIVITMLLLLCRFAMGQQGTLTGAVKDDAGTPLEFVNLAIRGTTTGVTTGKGGRFSLKVPANQEVTILISFVGYQTDSVIVRLRSGEMREVNPVLTHTPTQLSPVEVKDQQLRTSTFSRLDPKSMTYIPTINASVEDLIKTLPGVASRNELSSQYSVRGGNFDENLVFVNDIEVYRPFLVRSGQQEGLSFINPDLVSGISFSAGGFDAKYGDKMSSVLDIKYKKPTSFAGSFEVSILGASAHLEGTFAKKFSYLIGARYKTYSYFLNQSDTKGDYKPRYSDVQGTLNYEINSRWEISVLGYFSLNSYKLVPQSRATQFGSVDEAYKIQIYFDGNEKDSYESWLTSVTATYKPKPGLRLKLISSTYQTYERETYDINAEYWIGKLETFQGTSDYGQVTEVLGVGGYLDHARNFLDGTVYSLEHRGSLDKPHSQILWGARYQYESFQNKLNEYEVTDSAGYTLPRPPDSIGYPFPPHDSLQMTYYVSANQNTFTNLFSAFGQDTWNIDKPFGTTSLTAGVRVIYSDYNGDLNVNPRINVSFKPNWKRDIVFRFSGGYYSQPPTFREMTDLFGNIVPDLKSQTSIQAVLGSDLYFKAWGRPFKFTTEVYYKYLKNLIPYEVDNLKIRYYGTNDAHGYATGIDFRINGEFVKGAESWASLSIMSTQEYFEGTWIPRPTDQRVNLAIFFQDYIPKFPTWRVNLTFMYGSGLPIGPPDSPRSAQTLRLPPYRRIDIGIVKQLIGENTKFSAKNPLRAFDNLWIALEIFNLMDFSNTVSYLWVTDITGRQYAVPNYLVPRTFNLKLSASF